jgi:hypothetical protein
MAVTSKPQRIQRLTIRIRIIQNNKDAPQPRDREENSSVLLAVTRHDADPVAHSHPHVQQRSGEQSALLVEMGISPSRPGPRDYEAFSLAVVEGLEIEEFVEG